MVYGNMSSGAGVSPIMSKVSHDSSVKISTKSSAGKLISGVFVCPPHFSLQKLFQQRNKEIPFLDTLVFKEDNKLKTRVYHKKKRPKTVSPLQIMPPTEPERCRKSKKNMQ